MFPLTHHLLDRVLQNARGHFRLAKITGAIKVIPGNLDGTFDQVCCRLIHVKPTRPPMFRSCVRFSTQPMEISSIRPGSFGLQAT